MPMTNIITYYFCSRRASLPHTFASYLGLYNSCIALLCMTLHSNQSSIQYPRTSKEYINNLYILYILLSWTIPDFLVCHTLLQFLFRFFLSLQKNHSTSIVTLLKLMFYSLSSYDQRSSGLYSQQSLSIANNLPIPFIRPIMNTS